MITALLPVLTKIIGSVADKVFPNPADELKRQELQNAIQIAMIEKTGDIEMAAADIVKAEAQGESVLQRNWRPVLMLTFGALIVARWFGWSAPNLSESEYLKLWDIVQLGLGGYVIGRSCEKIAPGLAEVFKKK